MRRSDIFLAALAFALVAYIALILAHLVEDLAFGQVRAYYALHGGGLAPVESSGWALLWLGLLHFVVGLALAVLHVLVRGFVPRFTWRTGAGLGLIAWAGFAVPIYLIAVLFVPVPKAEIWATVVGWLVGFPAGGSLSAAILGRPRPG